jgi:hypothetical protein
MASIAREYTADDLAFLQDLLGDATDLNFNEPAPAVIQVQKYIGAIKAVERKQTQLLELMKETVQFYGKKSESCEQQVERLKTLIINQLNDIKLNSLATPRGTVSIKHLTKKHWPEDGALLQFCKERNLTTCIKTEVTEKVDKKGLATYLTENNIELPGYEEEEVMTLGIRG